MRSLPLADGRTLLGNRPVLILAPHPDDETFGCGGLVAECRSRGLDVHVVILTDGAASHPASREYPSERLVELRRAETREALGILGVPPENISFLVVRDGHLAEHARAQDRVTAKLIRYARTHQIGTILTTWRHDPHPDHRAAYQLGVHTARGSGARLFSYPVWGWTIPPRAWLPRITVGGARLDISRHRSLKRQACASYRSQISDLIRDDPGGFRMSPDVLALFDQPFEVFLAAREEG